MNIPSRASKTVVRNISFSRSFWSHKICDGPAGNDSFHSYIDGGLDPGVTYKAPPVTLAKSGDVEVKAHGSVGYGLSQGGPNFNFHARAEVKEKKNDCVIL